MPFDPKNDRTGVTGLFQRAENSLEGDVAVTDPLIAFLSRLAIAQIDTGKCLAVAGKPIRHRQFTADQHLADVGGKSQGIGVDKPLREAFEVRDGGHGVAASRMQGERDVFPIGKPYQRIELFGEPVEQFTVEFASVGQAAGETDGVDVEFVADLDPSADPFACRLPLVRPRGHQRGTSHSIGIVKKPTVDVQDQPHARLSDGLRQLKDLAAEVVSVRIERGRVRAHGDTLKTKPLQPVDRDRQVV